MSPEYVRSPHSPFETEGKPNIRSVLDILDCRVELAHENMGALEYIYGRFGKIGPLETGIAVVSLFYRPHQGRATPLEWRMSNDTK